jgi:hypothetical protein
MLKGQPWRRLAHWFSAVTLLLSVLSIGSAVFAPSGGAAAQSPPASTPGGAPTVVPAANPDGALCEKVRAVNGTFLMLDSEFGTVTAGNWMAYQEFLTSYNKRLSMYSQIFLDTGRRVPVSVRNSARKELTNIKAGQNRVLKAMSFADLNAAAGALAFNYMAAQGPILGYVGYECGLSQTFGLTLNGSVPGSRPYQTVPDKALMTPQ